MWAISEPQSQYSTDRVEVQEPPSPRAMAAILKATIGEDDALDLLFDIGERTGWTRQLNQVGLWLLKGTEDPAA